MRRTAGSSNDHANAASGSFARIFGSSFWRAMCRGYIDLIFNAKIFQRLSRLAHDLKIGIAPHHNRNQQFAHPLLGPTLLLRESLERVSKIDSASHQVLTCEIVMG